MCEWIKYVTFSRESYDAIAQVKQRERGRGEREEGREGGREREGERARERDTGGTIKDKG